MTGRLICGNCGRFPAPSASACAACGGELEEFRPGAPRPDPTAGILAGLQDILNDLVRVEMAPAGRRWQGCEFGKAHVGNSLLDAIERLGGDRRAALVEAATGAGAGGAGCLK